MNLLLSLAIECQTNRMVSQLHCEKLSLFRRCMRDVNMSKWCDQLCGIQSFFTHVDTAVFSSKGLVDLLEFYWQVVPIPSCFLFLDAGLFEMSLRW